MSHYLALKRDNRRVKREESRYHTLRHVRKAHTHTHEALTETKQNHWGWAVSLALTSSDSPSNSSPPPPKSSSSELSPSSSVGQERRGGWVRLSRVFAADLPGWPGVAVTWRQHESYVDSPEASSSSLYLPIVKSEQEWGTPPVYCKEEGQGFCRLVREF